MRNSRKIGGLFVGISSWRVAGQSWFPTGETPMAIRSDLDPSTVESIAESPAVVVAGSRSFGDGLDPQFVDPHVDAVLSEVPIDPACIVSGGARGADAAGERYADRHSLPVHVDEPDWETHGKAAGHRRNLRMAHKADAVVAFWDGQSSGTRSMIEYGCEVLGESNVFVEFYREGDPDPVRADSEAVQKRL